MTGRPVRRHQGSGRCRLDRSILESQEVDHQIPAVGQMEAEPVPALLVGGQLVGAELLIELADPPDFDGRLGAGQLHQPMGFQVGKGDVIRSLPRGGPFLTEPVRPVDDRGFPRSELQP